ncbi:MAG: YeeE/YedE family protein [Gammaproteobacteria bacterium]
MEALREHIVEHAPLWLAWGGFCIGIVFGWVVQQSHFCVMGSISDILSFADYRRFRSWLLAIAVALLGTQALASAGVVDLELSMYLAPSFNWLGNLVGGVLFGIGMVFAGGCTSRNLVRLGGGDVRALVVLVVVGITAYMTLGGILGPARAWLEEHSALSLETSQSAAALLAASGAGSAATLGWVISGLLGAGLVAYCFGASDFRTSPRHIAGGIGVGLCVVAGWALTGLSYDEFAAAPKAPISLTYVRPSGDTLEYLERYTAAPVPGFGVASVFGALAGALAAALATGRFKLTGFADPADTLRNLAGAALMGIGGIMALGCTIGQGVTGVATLAVGSMLSLGAIVAGGVIGVKWLEYLLDG